MAGRARTCARSFDSFDRFGGFGGNVSATQGDNNLKAPRLEVFYENANQPQAADKSGPASKAAKPVKAASASAGAPGDPMSSGQIKRIHAMGGKVV
ncbi:MAG: LptA/OstA family protein, partial [Rhodomicrobium sp.]